jgi:hypothetical protein
VLAASHLAWAAADGRPPAWDQAVHLEAALRCARVLGRGEWSRVLSISAFYPPLGHCAAGLLHRLVGPSPLAAVAVTQMALATAVLATYTIGARLGSAAAGLAAAGLLAGYTQVVLHSRTFMLDLPLTAIVALTVAVLLRTDGFTRRGWCVVAGLLGGLGLLTKWTYPVYVAPVAVIVWQAAQPGPGRATRARHVLLALALTATIAAPWYLRQVGLPISLVRIAFGRGAAEGDPAVLSVDAWIWYGWALVRQLGPPFAVLFALGLTWALARRPRGLALLLAWLVVPVVFFALLLNKDDRYTLPCLPAVALISSAWIARLRPPPARLAAGAILLVLVVHVAFLAWGWPAPAWARGRMTTELLFPSFPPVAERWPLTEILDRVSRDLPPERQRATLAVVPDTIYFSPFTLAYYATREERPIRVTKVWRGASPRFVDYVLTKSGDQGSELTTGTARAIMARLDADDPGLTGLLTPVAAFTLPDGSRATLHRVQAREVPGLSASALLERLRAAATHAVGWAARDIHGLALDIEPYGDAETRIGRLRRLTLRADSARVGDFRRKPVAIRVRDAMVSLEDVRLNPQALAARGEVELLGARRLVIARAAVAAADVGQALAELLPWLRRPAVAIADGRLELSAAVGGVPLAIALGIEPEPSRPGRLAVRAERARLGPAPVPALLVNAALGLVDPLGRLVRQPLAITPPRVRLTEGQVLLETP